MGFFNFQCSRDGCGCREQFDWTYSVVVAVALQPEVPTIKKKAKKGGKEASAPDAAEADSEPTITYCRGEYDGYGRFLCRVVDDDEEETFQGIGDFDAAGKLINPIVRHEKATIRFAHVYERAPGDIQPVGLYCYGPFRRTVHGTGDGEEDKQEIGTRFCTPPDAKILAGLPRSLLKKLRMQEIAKLEEAKARKTPEEKEEERIAKEEMMKKKAEAAERRANAKANGKDTDYWDVDEDEDEEEAEPDPDNDPNIIPGLQLQYDGGLMGAHAIKGLNRVPTLGFGWLPQMQVEGGKLGESIRDTNMGGDVSDLACAYPNAVGSAPVQPAGGGGGGPLQQCPVS